MVSRVRRRGRMLSFIIRYLETVSEAGIWENVRCARGERSKSNDNRALRQLGFAEVETELLDISCPIGSALNSWRFQDMAGGQCLKPRQPAIHTLAGCCGPEEAFHSNELQGAEGPRACTNFHPPPSSCTTPPSPRLHISASVLLFLILPLLLRGCRRRGAGLVLDHGAAASLGTTRGGPCEGGRPRGRPGLSRAPARTPQTPKTPSPGGR